LSSMDEQLSVTGASRCKSGSSSSLGRLSAQRGLQWVMDNLCSEAIVDQETLCPSCGYCLKWLAPVGQCPECGDGYEAVAGREKAAAEAFGGIFPGRTRCWLRPPRKLVGFPWLALSALVAVCALVAVAFVALQIGVTAAGFRLASDQYPIRYSSFGKFGVFGSHGLQYRYSMYAAIAMSIWFFVGELCFAGLILCRYALANRGLPRPWRIMHRIGVYACFTVPAILLPPMAAVTIWQLVNVAIRRRLYHYHYYLLPRIPSPTSAFRYRMDAVELAIWVVLIAMGFFLVTVFVRRHNRYIRQARGALRGAQRPIRPEKT